MKEVKMDAMGFWSKADHNLTEEDVDRISEGMVLSTAVDRGQMPLNTDAVPDSPERSLVRAILFDAVECSTRHIDSRIPSQRKEAAEALEWIESDDETWFLSFRPLCNLLGVDDGFLRRLVRGRIRDSRAVQEAHFEAA
jgi:hypothetical protein